MIREQVKREDINQFGDELEGGYARISKESLGSMFDTLVKQYKDPYGSIIRELTSNIFDTHTEVGKNHEPAIVGFTNDYQYLYFKDKGKGMNPEFIRDIYMSYGESTRRESNNALGMFGLGSKSPLSIRTEYYIDSIVDGIEYSYIIFVGDDNLPQYRVLSETETEEENGTTVKVDLNHESYVFKKAIQRQLLYFDNVYVDNVDDIENEYKIYYLDNARIKEESPIDEFHICYGKVYYPVDLYDLMDDAYEFPLRRIPFGLYFDIGQLRVIPGRENIRYEKEEKELVKEKIKDLCIELVDKYNKEVKEYADDIVELQKLNKGAVLEVAGYKIEIEKVIKFLDREYALADITISKTKYRPFEKLGLKTYHNIPFFYDLSYYFNNFLVIKDSKSRIFDSSNKGKHFVVNFAELFFLDEEETDEHGRTKNIPKYKKNLYRNIDGKRKTNVNKYIKDAYVIRLKSKESLFKNFKIQVEVHKRYLLEKEGKIGGGLKLARTVYIEIVKAIIKYTKKYENIEVPKEFKPKPTIKIEANGGFILNFLGESVKKYRKREVKRNDFRKGLHVIAVNKDEKFIEIINQHRHHHVYYYTATQTEYRRLFNEKLVDNETYKNVIELGEFTKHKVFRDIATNILIDDDSFFNKLKDSSEEIRQYENRSLYSPTKRKMYHPKYRDEHEIYECIEVVRFLNEDVYNHVIKLVKFNKENKIYFNENEDFKKDMIDIAKEHNYFNQEILLSLKKIKEFLKGIELIFSLKAKEEDLPFIIDYAKSKKKRLGLEHYGFNYKAYELELYDESQEKIKYLDSLKVA